MLNWYHASFHSNRSRHRRCRRYLTAVYMASRQLRRSETHTQHHRCHRYRYRQPLYPAKSLDTVGKPTDVAKIPSTACLVGLVSCVIAFRISTARVAFMAHFSARPVEFRHRYCCESNSSQGATGSAPLPSYSCPNPPRQYRIPRSKKTGSRRILPTNECSRCALRQMSYVRTVAVPCRFSTSARIRHIKDGSR